MLDVQVRHRLGSFVLDAAFTAPVPGVTVLFGPSGAGKSSVLLAVAGLLRPEAGRVAVGEAVLADSAAWLWTPPERRRCGVVFQDSRLFPHLSVASNLRYGARRAPAGAPGPGFDAVVDLLGLAPVLSRRPRHLSGGERQRVALGRALLTRPRLLLMDEPLAALDWPRKAEIMAFLERIRDAIGVPILYVTHALDEVDRLADTLVLMEAGRVLAAGKLAEITARTDLTLLTSRRDAGVVLACTILQHDKESGLTRLDFAGGALLVPLRAGPVGGAVRVRVRARDVALATVLPTGLSILNALPATVAAMARTGQHEVLVTLAVGPATLLSRISREAVDRLSLTPGQAVHALVKSAAFSDGLPTS